MTKGQGKSGTIALAEAFPYLILEFVSDLLGRDHP